MRQQKRSSTCAGDEILFGVAQDIGHCITTRVFSLQSINNRVMSGQSLPKNGEYFKVVVGRRVSKRLRYISK